MHFLDTLDHLVRNVQHSFQVEFAPALLEQVFQRLAQQIHHHHVVHLTVVGFLVADEVQEGHEGLATHLVDEFGLPEEHNVSLHFNCFFDFGSEEFSSLFLLNFINFSEGTSTKFLNHSVAAI